MESGNPASVEETPLAGLTVASGDTLCVAPSAPNRYILVHYLSYNPQSAPVTCAFRFGAGPLFLVNTILQGGAVVAKDFGDFRFIKGAAGEALYFNQDQAVSTAWNAFYREVG
jgi:hypothetical protein